MTQSRFPDAPARIRASPIDRRGFPVPWFVAWLDGEPVFPAISPEKMARAIRHDLCWVCGQRMGRHRVFVVGPMCVANLISSEPPSHYDCARFAAEACPFLANPNMKRVPTDKYGGTVENVAGIMIDRNPGVTALVTCAGKTRWHRDGPGVLFDIDGIDRVEWFACGREASRAEVEEAFDSGLPILRQMAEQEGVSAVRMLDKREVEARAYFPAQEAA